MSKNLEYKISLLLDDIEGLSRQDKAAKIKELINSELEWHDMAHAVDNYDLNTIRSSAVKFMTDMSINHMNETGIRGDSHRQQALSYVEAVVGFLRKEKLISFRLFHIRKK